MNNSSAYNNVLLKPSVQTQAAQAPVQKRTYDDDQPSTSFQQNFKDAHDHVRAHDEKAAKPAVIKKTAQAENRKSANEPEKSSPTPKQLDENRSCDQADKSKQTSDADQSFANQNPEAKNPETKSSRDQEAESTEVPKDASLNEDSAPGTSVPEVLFTNTTVQSSVPLDAVTPISTDIGLASIPATAETSAPTAAVNPTTTDKTISESLILESAASAADAEATDLSTGALSNLKKTDKQMLADEQPATLKSDVTDAIAQPLVADSGLLQTSAATTPDVVVEQTAAVLAAVGSSVLPKPALTQTTVADEISEAEVPGALINPLTTEKSLGKAPVANDPGLTLASDANSAQSQVLDAKSSFEKTLQNMTLPESGKREENAVLPAANQANSTTSSNINTPDAIARFNDAQAPAARSFIVQTAVPVPVGQPQWSQAVGEKVLWLAAQNVSAAEIHLNPENLGPMQVKVSVNQEQTTVNFTSHHAVVREVLDQNLGRLRDMFSEQGLNLVNVDVSDKSFSRQQGDAKDQKGQANSNDTQVEDEAPVAMSLIKQQRLVDHYA